VAGLVISRYDAGLLGLETFWFTCAVHDLLKATLQFWKEMTGGGI
jgi:hypothetical protein